MTTPYQRQRAYRDRIRTARDAQIEELVSAYAAARTSRVVRFRYAVMNETNPGLLLAMIARFNLEEANALQTLNNARKRVCKKAAERISGKRKAEDDVERLYDII